MTPTNTATADGLHLLGIAGSLRRGSYNRMLLEQAVDLAPDGVRITIFERLGEIPLFNEDVEAEGYPEPVRALKRAIKETDGLLITTPEYNYGIPGVLKNAIDWASRPAGESPLQGKPAAVMGASMGMAGTARAQLGVRDAFVFTQTPVLPGPEVLVASAHEQFDDDGLLKREDTRQFVTSLLERFAEFARALAREPAGVR